MPVVLMLDSAGIQAYLNNVYGTSCVRNGDFAVMYFSITVNINPKGFAKFGGNGVFMLEVMGISFFRLTFK